MGLLQRLFKSGPAVDEAADCDECGRGVAPHEGIRETGHGKVWCSTDCAEIGVERFAI